MTVIEPPRERECERCGRTERWNDEHETWVGDSESGEPHCVHVWNITGSFNPLAGSG